MYLTIASTAPKASDLGFLLHKHPARAQTFDLPVGAAHVFYPEAGHERCEVALLLEVDPIALVRGKKFSGAAFSLGQYVNDRPYAASSLLAVALGRVFTTAMTGRCTARPELEGAVLPLDVHVPALPSRGGPDLVRRLFEPLGWEVDAVAQPLDPTISEWGDSRYVGLRLRGETTLAAALTHLYVLLPVLDGAKHYWVSDDEVDKLVRAGSTWLPEHPERELVMHRYLAHQRHLVDDATSRLTALDDVPDDASVPEDAATGATGATVDAATTAPERATRPLPMSAVRRAALLGELRAAGAARVVDLGCGEGELLRDLLQDASFTEVLGVDVSPRALDRARRRLGLDRMPDSQRARLTLLQSSLTYRDGRIAGFDAVVLSEVIEHLDPDRVPALERTVFADARPSTALVTTPNAEFNVRYGALLPGTMRHADHRFEWTRQEFADWGGRVAREHGYSVRFVPVGDDDPEVGASTQMAVFTRSAPGAETAGTTRTAGTTETRHS